MTDTITALHPDPNKQPTTVNREKYEAVRAALLNILEDERETPFKELAGKVAARLTDFDGSPGWWTTTVKLDLEARGLVERVPGQSPQVVRLKATPE